MEGRDDKRTFPGNNSTTSGTGGGSSPHSNTALPDSLSRIITPSHRDSGTRTTLSEGRARDESDEEPQDDDYDRARPHIESQSLHSSGAHYGSPFGPGAGRYRTEAAEMSSTPSTSLASHHAFAVRQAGISSSFSAIPGLPMPSSTSTPEPPLISSSSSTSSQLSSLSQQHRTQYSSNDQYAAMPPVVASRGSGVRPIRSDPAYYAQASGYSSYGQSGHHLPFPGRSNPSRDTGLYGSSGPMLPPPDPYSRQVYEPSSSGHYGNYLPPPVLPPLDPFRRESLSSQHHQPAGSLPTPFLGQRFDENSESRLIGRKRGGTDEDGSSVSEGLEADSFGIEPGGTTSGTMSRTATPSGASSTEAGTSQSKVPKKTLIACDFCRGRKLRCDGARPSCSNCKSRDNQPCNYQPSLRRRGPGKAKKSSKVERAKQNKSDAGQELESGAVMMDAQRTQLLRFKTPFQSQVGGHDDEPMPFAGAAGPSRQATQSRPSSSVLFRGESTDEVFYLNARVPPEQPYRPRVLTTPGGMVSGQHQHQHFHHQPFQPQPRPHSYPSHPQHHHDPFQQHAYPSGLSVGETPTSSSWPGHGSAIPSPTIKTESDSSSLDWSPEHGPSVPQQVQSTSLSPVARHNIDSPSEASGSSRQYTTDEWDGWRYYDARDPTKRHWDRPDQSAGHRSSSPSRTRGTDMEG